MRCSHYFRRNRATGTSQRHVNLDMGALKSDIIDQPQFDDTDFQLRVIDNL